MLQAANDIKKQDQRLLRLQEHANGYIKKAIKYITANTVQPLAKRYVSKHRVYRYKGITLQVPQTVFHPGLFFSTRLLLKFIEELDLKGKAFLEPGAGSGLIALSAARKGAVVTATDINATAVEYLRKNSVANKIAIRVIWSDLFDNIPIQHFDVVAINSPYYKKNPATDEERAWYCGENGEYFYKLFKSLADYMGKSSAVYMILCEGCDIEMIQKIAVQNSLGLKLVQEKKKLMEMNYIFKIETLTVKDA